MSLTTKSAVLIVSLLMPLVSFAQQVAPPTGVLRGQVTDPTGAVVPGAQISLSKGHQVQSTQTQSDGHYSIRTLAGSYQLRVSARGFEPIRIPRVDLTEGMVKELNVPLSIAMQHQSVTVDADLKSVGVNPAQSAGQMVFKGSDLKALSDDPDELRSELEQLASAAAGPNGGQIYVDGFAANRLPPKSSILEIRVNQNPFSSEFDRIGYGRVEIITKPGTQLFHGSLAAYGNNSALNSANPLVARQPAYYMYSYSGSLEGPLGKRASFSLSGDKVFQQGQSIVNAVNPQNPSSNIAQAAANPTSVLVGNPRIDVQAGNHTLSFRDYFYKSNVSGADVGALYLASQALTTMDEENTAQFADTFVVNPRLLNELHLEWRRAWTMQSAVSTAPARIVSGAFVDGGNLAGNMQDHLQVAELQDYVTTNAGNHILRFGLRLRGYYDKNSSTAGSNGAYTYNSIADFQANAPSQYSVTNVSNPLAKVFLADGAGFFQDDWRAKPNLMFGLGIRFEAQNWMHDHTDWAPRLALAWSPGRPSSAAGKTVIRAGYGWFYERFTVPSSFASYGDAPYIIQTIHDNGVNQQSLVVNNPGTSASTTTPSVHTIDSHFHAALNMQAGAGVDQQFSRIFTANLTYLFTQGVHQYLSNNVTAPVFNPNTYTLAGPAPSTYNYQFQSGGFFKQHQVIATLNLQTSHLTLNGSYVYNVAHSDTQGIETFASVSQNPGFDYGRATFAVRHHANILESYSAPFGFVIASLFTVQSGTPFNLTIGNDLTGNNQFNARPTYGVCGAVDVVATRYGCLDTNPRGKGEPIVPAGVGIGPSNMLLDLRLSKTFGVGPRVKTETGGATLSAGDDVSDRGLGSSSSSIRLNASAPRRYSLSLVAGASNVLNIVNRGVPDGVVLSPIFNQSQSLAGGAFANPTPGNRALVFQMNFSF